MKAQDVLGEDHLIAFIPELYEGELHAKRVVSLAYGTLGVLTSASLAVHATGESEGAKLHRRRALRFRWVQFGEELLHVPLQQGAEGSGVLQDDTELSPVDLGAVGMPDDMAKAAQIVEKWQGLGGDGGRPNAGHRDTQQPSCSSLV